MATKQIRPIRVEGNVAYVPLTQGYEAVIDVADVPLVEGRNWYADKGGNTFYAKSSGPKVDGKQVGLKLHKLLMPDADVVDHRDGDGLNNRRGNLRSASNTLNRQNSCKPKNNRSGLKGVVWHKASGKWLAQIGANGRKVHLGLHSTAEAAAAAYAKASAELHGAFGRTA